MPPIVIEKTSTGHDGRRIGAEIRCPLRVAAEAYDNLGSCYLNRDDSKRAIRMFEKAVKLLGLPLRKPKPDQAPPAGPIHLRL